MTDDDCVATTDENGKSIEYVSIEVMEKAFINGMCVGGFIITIGFSILIMVTYVCLFV